MEQRIYHGDISPDNIGRALIAKFNHGNLRAQQLGSGDQVVVQIATQPGARAGGDTALSITIQKVPDGLAIQVGKQAWLGVAASLGMSAFTALRNPLALLGRIDDIAQDIENLSLDEKVWEAVDEIARATGTGFELTERLKRSVCPYCNTANPIGEPACIACGAPLGDAQPSTCPNCGYIIKHGEHFCPNCGKPITQ